LLVIRIAVSIAQSRLPLLQREGVAGSVGMGMRFNRSVAITVAATESARGRWPLYGGFNRSVAITVAATVHPHRAARGVQ